MPAPKGNRNAEKYTQQQAIDVFERVLKDAQQNDECLSIQDACMNAGIPSSTFYNLVEKFIVLESYKRDINDAIVARINRNALRNKFNATASIWRMKQLGERDKQEIENSGSQNINITRKIVNGEKS